MARAIIGKPLANVKGHVVNKEVSIVIGSLGPFSRPFLVAELDMDSRTLHGMWFCDGRARITAFRRDFYTGDPVFDKQVIVRSKDKVQVSQFLTQERKDVILKLMNNSCSIKDGKIVWELTKFSNIDRELENIYDLLCKAVPVLTA